MNRTQTITLADGRKVRTATKADLAHLRAIHNAHENWKISAWILHKEWPMVVGRIGYSGTKTHRITTTVVNINGELVLTSAWSVCGSQRFGSGLSIHTDTRPVDCKKCLPKGGK